MGDGPQGESGSIEFPVRPPLHLGGSADTSALGGMNEALHGQVGFQKCAAQLKVVRGLAWLSKILAVSNNHKSKSRDTTYQIQGGPVIKGSAPSRRRKGNLQKNKDYPKGYLRS